MITYLCATPPIPFPWLGVGPASLQVLSAVISVLVLSFGVDRGTPSSVDKSWERAPTCSFSPKASYLVFDSSVSLLPDLGSRHGRGFLFLILSCYTKA